MFCLLKKIALFLIISSQVFADTNDDIEEYSKWKYAVQHPNDYIKVFSFFYNNPHWPLFEESVKNAEKNIDSKIDDSLVIKWFKRYPPKTSYGVIAYINSLLKIDPKQAQEYIEQTWIFQNLSPKFAKTYRDNFKNYITPIDDAKRAKRLIKENKIEQLVYMKDSVIDEISNYISNFLNKYFSAKSENFSPDDISDINKRYNIIQNLIDNNLYKKAANILTLTNKDEERYAFQFFNQRRNVSFNLLRSGNPQLAYNIMKMHKLTGKDENISKAEWLLGFISYRFLNKPTLAKKHFENAYNNCKNSIRISKNAFWLAEVCRSRNDVLLAMEWYKKAALYFSTFYGYLAQSRLKDMASGKFSLADDFYSPENQNHPVQAEMIFYNRELVKILISIANFEKDDRFITYFYKQLIDDIEDPNEEVILMDLAASSGNIGALISSASQKQHYFSNKKVYKTLDDNDMRHVLKVNSDPCFISLVHSIILRESNFNKNAKSYAGAVGLMQVMPSTAIYEAKRIQFYVGRESLFDKQKNITIGSSILNRLLKKYNNNLIYVAAAYNCGEENVSKFQKSIKNLKNLTDLDIMELIPIKETRVYVKHVIRNMFTYQEIFNNNGRCYNCDSLTLLK